MSTINFILFTVILACSSTIVLGAADVSDLTITEFNGGLSTIADSLLASAADLDIGSSSNSDNAAKTGKDLTGGSGSGIKVTVQANGDVLGSITVTNPGKGYKVGDVLTLPIDELAAFQDSAVVFTLTKDNFPNRELRLDADALLHMAADLDIGSTSNADNAAKTGKDLTGGSGSGIQVTVQANGDVLGSITVTNPGNGGYQVGDELTLPIDELAAFQDSAVVFTLTPDAFVGITKETPKTGIRDWKGALNTFTGYEAPSTGALTGYYLPLLKTTRFVQVTATFGSPGTLTPQLGTTSDSTLATLVPSTILFSVADGLNVMKLVSADGTYEINLVKPDDEIKMIQNMKRSIEIAYTPAAVGEFTCSAFTNSASAPNSRATVKTGTGVVTKSVRTNNIVQENIFNSVQMTLNGLTPNTEYDIHCFHLSHGLISNTASSVKTDLASLTGVSLTATTTAGADPGTLTLTFTHEGLLSTATAIVIVEIFHDYVKADLTNTADCSSAQTVQSGGTNVNGAEVCSGLTVDDEWKTTFHSTGSSAAGSQVVITLTNPSNMIPNNQAGALTFHLEVSGHSKLLHQEIESV